MDKLTETGSPKEKLKELESLHPDDLVEYILKTVDNVVKRSYSGDPNKQ